MNYKKNNAVSEVVGVLLMLTITIILVSLVAVVMNGTVDETETPITANVVASDVDEGSIIMENIAGDSFSLNQVEVRLGVREDPTRYVILRNGESTYLVSFTGDNIIALGDRFKVVGTQKADGISWGSFNVSTGEHLTYRFYDASGKPISSGEIMIA